MDYKKNGICEGMEFNPLNHTTSSCETKTNDDNITEIVDGVCSRKTEKLLMRKECVLILQDEPILIWRNLLYLLYSMCKTNITREIFKPLEKNPNPTARFGIFHTVREDENKPISLNLHFGKIICNPSYINFKNKLIIVKSMSNHLSW